MPINLTKDFYSDMFIKPNVIKEINEILVVFKKIAEQNECTDSICFVTDILNEAKNLNGFINELLVTNGFKFKVLDASEEIDCIYTAVINSFNRPKGVLLNISEYNLRHSENLRNGLMLAKQVFEEKEQEQEDKEEEIEI